MWHLVSSWGWPPVSRGLVCLLSQNRDPTALSSIQSKWEMASNRPASEGLRSKGRGVDSGQKAPEPGLSGIRVWVLKNVWPGVFCGRKGDLKEIFADSRDKPYTGPMSWGSNISYSNFIPSSITGLLRALNRAIFCFIRSVNWMRNYILGISDSGSGRSGKTTWIVEERKRLSLCQTPSLLHID